MKTTNWFDSSLVGATCGLFLLVFATSAKATPVDIELGLIIDGSDSISQDNFDKQLEAYKNIFSSQDFFDKIVDKLPSKKLAIGAIQFSDGIRQDTPYGIPWTLIDSQETAISFSQQFANLSKLGGFSNIGGGIFVTAAGCSQYRIQYRKNPPCNVTGINDNGFEGQHSVLDISTDGYTARSTPAPFNASIAVVTNHQINAVNAISVGSQPDTNTLNGLVYGKNCYDSDCTNSTPAFVQLSGSPSNFEATFFQKLLSETVGIIEEIPDNPGPVSPDSGSVSPTPKPSPTVPPPQGGQAATVPEPSSLLGLAIVGILGLGSQLRRKFNF